MAANDPAPSANTAEMQNRLNEVSELLRESTTLQPEVREVLVELLGELNTALASSRIPSDQVAHLAGTAAHLAEVLHQQQPGWMERVRSPFEEAAVQAETHAPGAVGLVRRLLNLLSDMGI